MQRLAVGHRALVVFSPRQRVRIAAKHGQYAVVHTRGNTRLRGDILRGCQARDRKSYRDCQYEHK